MFVRSAYLTRSFRCPKNFMSKGASHLVLSGMPSIRTIAASRLDESRFLAFARASGTVDGSCADSTKPKTQADYRAKPNVSPMAFRTSTPLRWSKPTHYPRARSAMTKADHAPPATTNGLSVPISLADRSSGRPAAGDGREPFRRAPTQPGRALQVRKTISGT